jgi:hypothetical protein
MAMIHSCDKRTNSLHVFHVLFMLHEYFLQVNPYIYTFIIYNRYNTTLPTYERLRDVSPPKVFSLKTKILAPHNAKCNFLYVPPLGRMCTGGSEPEFCLSLSTCITRINVERWCEDATRPSHRHQKVTQSRSFTAEEVQIGLTGT